MTDAEVLRAAAARIREVGFDPASAMAEADLDVMEGEIDRLFIVGPSIAAPLAEWLDTEVSRAYVHDYGAPNDDAVRLARALLGETP